MKNEVTWVDIQHVQPCDWNYKLEGTPEELEKLKNSISKDGSVGVLPVRTIKGKTLEVIDGNHRLQALQELGWEQVPVENFGSISKAEAITIARRRNEEWFQTDPFKYAELLKNDVLTEFSLEELTSFMPESEAQMKALLDSLDFNLDDEEQPASEGNHHDTAMRFIRLAVPENKAVEFEEDLKDFLQQHPDVQMK